MLIDLRVSSVPENFRGNNLAVIELCSILLVSLGYLPIILGFAAWKEGWVTLLFLLMKISII